MATDVDEMLDSVLDALADELELERELGARLVETGVKIAELAPPPRPTSSPKADATAARPAAARPAVAAKPAVAPQVAAPAGPAAPADAAGVPPVAFVHDRPLSPKAVEMMAKTVVALGYADGSVPVAVARPIPKARRYVFLGHRALKAYLPGMRVEENAKFRTPKGVEALLVKSPEDIVRFTTVTPAVKQEKTAMWRALKAFAIRPRS